MTKTMQCLISPTVRGIIKRVNETGIKKDDIVGMFKSGEQFYLIYYREGNGE